MFNVMLKTTEQCGRTSNDDKITLFRIRIDEFINHVVIYNINYIIITVVLALSVMFICIHNIFFLQFEDTKGIHKNRQSSISLQVFYCLFI
jgi:hypothetical protein